MECKWIKITPNVQKGITIINQFDDSKFEPFLKRIAAKLKLQESEIFTEDERQKLQVVLKIEADNLMIAIKTVIYLYKRLSKFIFMPIDLNRDLVDVGFYKEKAEFIVKVWSSEISSTLNDLVTRTKEKNKDNEHLSWKLNTELSSDIHKKCKTPKAYLLISNNDSEQEMELTHSDLYSVFIQLESIQNELDNTVL